MSQLPKPARLDDGLSSGFPRVLELPSLASLYIQPLTPMGTVENGRAATGFIVRNTRGMPYLVTNRHVVTGRNSLDGDKSSGAAISALRVFLPRADRLGEWLPVVLELWDASEDPDDPVRRPSWLEHPDLGWKVDVVAIPLSGPSFERDLDLMAYTVSGAALPRLAVASELHVIGFPLGFDPFKAQVPLGVWTRGTIAWHPSLDWQGLPATLIDCRARPGQSGSPVVFSAAPFTRFVTSAGVIQEADTWTYDLVGIYSGRIVDGSDVGVVWKRSAIDAVVEQGVQPDGPTVSPFDEAVNIEDLLTARTDMAAGGSAWSSWPHPPAGGGGPDRGASARPASAT
ncbi:trypsin-like peptidase domain-containing protein [Kitasatospora sp. NPDC059160]|uniref:trypsin-like peptidase domain-containing protein n=1 Tax=Kitasatospora sp. NPDC059160 TaxID=3346748 RepID=UPI0036C32198